MFLKLGTCLNFPFVSKNVVGSVAKKRIVYCRSIGGTRLGKICAIVFELPTINELDAEDFKLKQIVFIVLITLLVTNQ